MREPKKIGEFLLLTAIVVLAVVVVVVAAVVDAAVVIMVLLLLLLLMLLFSFLLLMLTRSVRTIADWLADRVVVHLAPSCFRENIGCCCFTINSCCW